MRELLIGLLAGCLSFPFASLCQATENAPRADERGHVLLHVQIVEVSLGALKKAGLQMPAGMVAQCQLNPGSSTNYQVSRSEVAEFVESARKESALRVLAQANLVAPTGRPVSFTNGGEIPVPCRRDKSREVEYKQLGTQIDALASLLDDGQLRLQIRPTYRELLPALGVEVGGIRVPAIRVHSLDTGCDVALGKTVVLGGPTEQRACDEMRQGKVQTRIDRVQTLFLVTPELVDAKPPTEEVDSHPSVQPPKPSAVPTAQAPNDRRKK